MPEPRYSDAYVHLRRPEARDAQAVFDLSHDAAVMRFYGMRPFADLGEARAQVDWYLGLLDQQFLE